MYYPIIPTEEKIIIINATENEYLKDILYSHVPFNRINRTNDENEIYLEVYCSRDDIDLINLTLQEQNEEYFANEADNDILYSILELMKDCESKNIKSFIYKEIEQTDILKVKIKKEIEVDRQYYFNEMEIFVSSYEDRIIEVKKVKDGNNIYYKPINLEYYHFFENMVEAFVK